MTDFDLNAPATKRDITEVLQLVADLSATLTSLTIMFGRLMQLQLRGIEWAERHTPQPDHPPARFTVHGESITLDSMLDAMQGAQAMLDQIAAKAKRKP